MELKECSVDGCTAPARARGWCSRHYARWNRLGDVREDMPLRSYVRSGTYHNAQQGECRACGALLVQQAVGRPRYYCDKTCEAKERSRRRSAIVQAARRCHICGGPAQNKTGKAICADCKVLALSKRVRTAQLRTYGITADEYDSMLDQQDGRCAICATDKPGQGRANFCVDHCHGTGKVRGLLCISCNIGIGQFKDDPALLRAAIAYLDS